MDFKNEVAFLEQDDQYKMVWSNSVIYPGLTEDDKVRVSVIQAQRGQILDRNGRMLAGKGVASSVGITPVIFACQDKKSMLAKHIHIHALSAKLFPFRYYKHHLCEFFICHII